MNHRENKLSRQEDSSPYQGNRSSSAVGVAKILVVAAVSAVSAVGAGVQIIKKVTEAKSANKVAHLEDSVRNSAKNLDIDKK